MMKNYSYRETFKEANQGLSRNEIIDYSDKSKLSSVCDFRKKKLKKNATKSELIFKAKLTSLKIKFRFQKAFIKDYFCIVDFYIPFMKLVIEIDGEYHFTPEQIIKDNARTNYLVKKRGLNVLRYTNKQAEEISCEDLLKKFKEIKQQNIEKNINKMKMKAKLEKEKRQLEKKL
jgi:very-short-patch-repair endonuclease